MKNKRIEFRAGEDEIETFRTFAAREKLSVSEWLRNAAFRATEEKIYENYSAGNVPESAEYIQEVAAVKVPPDLKRFKQLVAYLQARMPKDEAEEVARKRLGME